MNNAVYYAEHPSPLGQLILATTDRGICKVCFHDQRYFHGPKTWQKESHPFLVNAAKQIDEYFAGHRKEFDVELDLDANGTAFQQAVWRALLTIEFGNTRNYGMHATLINKPTAARAVGGAVGRNPISIIVPCHRVIGSNGALTGFAGGLKRKEYLLKLEGVIA
ncbi:MAG: ogt1 [Solimicrobium sp.]|jgi:methylated-DNA-[protein]-cysteine S-methyltransferase|nr:ogt1 [Solimicrobium sp.]